MLPKEVVWYRAYQPGNPVPAYPTFFGDMETAWLYASKTGRPLGAYRARRGLRLLDLRYVQNMLRPAMRRDAAAPILQKATCALGICSLQAQIRLLEEYVNANDGLDRMREFALLAPEELPGWCNPYELQGVRVGITDIDHEVMAFLNDLFGQDADGIIAPRMPSPYHDQWHSDIRKSVMMEEVILFRPQDVLWHDRDVPVGPRVVYEPNMPMALLQDVLIGRLDVSWSHGRTTIRRHTTRTSGGSSGPALPRDYVAERIAEDPDARKAFERERAGWRSTIRRLRKEIRFLRAPSFMVPWIKPELSG